MRTMILIWRVCHLIILILIRRSDVATASWSAVMKRSAITAFALRSFDRETDIRIRLAHPGRQSMQWLLSSYTLSLNRRCALFGHVFSGRYKALLEGSGHGYLKTVCDYVRLNLARAGLIASR